MTHLPFALFDMDGTLVDSMQYWRGAHIEGLTLAGYEVTDEMKEALRKVWGYENLRELLATWGIHKTVETLKEEARMLLRRHYEVDVEAKPKVKALLEEMREQGVTMAVFTLTPHELVDICLEKTGLREYFSYVITTEDNPTGTGKESPEMFQVALDLIDCDAPQKCALFEDSYYSIRTGKELGMRVIGVDDVWQSQHQKEQMRDACYTILDLS